MKYFIGFVGFDKFGFYKYLMKYVFLFQDLIKYLISEFDGIIDFKI
jgi:hypothetical protein